MKNVKFDLNQKPKTTYDEVAYLVTRLSWDENQSYVDANQTYYTRYYICPNALMTVE